MRLLHRKTRCLSLNIFAISRLRPLLVFAAFFLLWELLVNAFHLPAYLLPAPTAVVWDLYQQAWALMGHTFVTGQEVVFGYVIAILIGIPLAMLISFSKIAREILYPILIISQVVPKVVLAPLFIIWFGIGMMPKLILVFLLCFFPIVLSAVAGFRAIDDETIEFAQSTGATPWRQFRLIRFPHALPSIFVGLKLAATMSVIGAIVAEFVSSDRGLGYVLMLISGEMNTTRAFSIIVILSLMGLALYWLVELIERLVIPWHSSQRH